MEEYRMRIKTGKDIRITARPGILPMLVILCMLVLSGCQSREKLPFYNTPDFTPVWLTKSEASSEGMHHIGPFTLVNQNGEIISNKNVNGKVYVANFFFTTCGSICPRMMINIKKVQEQFANEEEVRFLSHTVQPERDSVARLKHYAGAMAINSAQWWLLTGSKDSIYTLARRFYFADDELGYAKGSNEFLHTENCVLIDRQGRIRGVYNATLELEMQKLAKHISILLNEERR